MSTISIVTDDNRAQWLNTSRDIGQGIKFSTPLADNVMHMAQLVADTLAPDLDAQQLPNRSDIVERRKEQKEKLVRSGNTRSRDRENERERVCCVVERKFKGRNKSKSLGDKHIKKLAFRHTP